MSSAARPGDKKPVWSGGMDPYSRGMQDIADHDAKLANIRKQDEMIRTVEDLLRLTGLQDEGIEITVTLEDLYTTLNSLPGDKKGTDGGRTRCIAKLKEGGVSKLVHRQKMASELSKARREARLKPAKAQLPAPAGMTTGPAVDVAAAEAAPGAGNAMAASPSETVPPKLEGEANAAGDDKGKPAPARPSSIANPMQEAMLAGLAAPGQRVLLKGLSARPELNGRSGTIGSFNSERGRYMVDLKAPEDETTTSDETVALKPQNLDLAALCID